MPEQYQVITTPRAHLDLDDIYNYIAKDSPQNAKKFVTALVEAVHSLQTMPKRYRVYQRGRRGKTTLRRMPIGMYLVYYWVDDGKRTVEVLTIRHGMRRQPRKFPGR